MNKEKITKVRITPVKSAHCSIEPYLLIRDNDVEDFMRMLLVYSPVFLCSLFILVLAIIIAIAVLIFMVIGFFLGADTSGSSSISSFSSRVFFDDSYSLDRHEKNYIESLIEDEIKKGATADDVRNLVERETKTSWYDIDVYKNGDTYNIKKK